MGKHLMTEIIHTYDIQSVIFNITLREKNAGLSNPEHKKSIPMVREKRKECVFYKTFVIICK